MSIAELWDRAWWGFMITIIVGLLWLKFLDPYLSCVWTGLIFSVLCGGIFVYTGVRKMRRKHKVEEQMEEE
jgi:uncharacterized membrane-anchored protein YhcB (DUF1043 family)